MLLKGDGKGGGGFGHELLGLGTNTGGKTRE